MIDLEVVGLVGTGSSAWPGPRRSPTFASCSPAIHYIRALQWIFTSPSCSTSRARWPSSRTSLSAGCASCPLPANERSVLQRWWFGLGRDDGNGSRAGRSQGHHRLAQDPPAQGGEQLAEERNALAPRSPSAPNGLQVSERLTKAGPGSCTYIQADIGSKAGCEALVAEVKKRTPVLNIVSLSRSFWPCPEHHCSHVSTQ